VTLHLQKYHFHVSDPQLLLISLQLPLAPVMVFAIGIEDPLTILVDLTLGSDRRRAGVGGLRLRYSAAALQVNHMK
jgi:hypothetical protein